MTPVAAEAAEKPVSVAVPHRPPPRPRIPLSLLPFLIRHQRFVRQHRTGLHHEHRQSVLLRTVLRTIDLGWRLQWWSQRWLRRRLRQGSRRRLRRRQLRLLLFDRRRRGCARRLRRGFRLLLLLLVPRPNYVSS